MSYIKLERQVMEGFTMTNDTLKTKEGEKRCSGEFLEEFKGSPSLNNIVEEIEYKKNRFLEIKKEEPNITELEMNRRLDFDFMIWRYTNR